MAKQMISAEEALAARECFKNVYCDGVASQRRFYVFGPFDQFRRPSEALFGIRSSSTGITTVQVGIGVSRSAVEADQAGFLSCDLLTANYEGVMPAGRGFIRIPHGDYADSVHRFPLGPISWGYRFVCLGVYGPEGETLLGFCGVGVVRGRYVRQY